ncbi:MAG TPA: DUF3536 domain-containing protein [Nitrospirae bacterium]|nr:DUF3536 domain-containing protein [Nitrospirota bacterium]
MKRYICIHGHFYQPPRENPWLEEVETQDSAYPYHDWNERITAECYAPNTASRILNPDGVIVNIVNNYSRISFNFGPTLLSWLQRHNRGVYEAILEADRLSMERFSGHGSAIAQVYNHMIMPLATKVDKYTQILWGIRDFQYRFKRDPEGMWLPETAVDTETLEILSEMGIRFTILSPTQALKVRSPGGKSEWTDVRDGKIDPSMPYLCRLPSGRQISIFFYDGPISRDVAFGGLLHNGEAFAKRLLSAFNDKRTWPQIVHIATDGETFGHHHRGGDMALAYCLYYIEKLEGVELINYGAYLEKHPPRYEVKIVEKSSWSCVHGVKRWKEDCGCNTGRNPQWTQAWRRPLRDAMDRLRHDLARIYKNLAPRYLKNPQAARDDYISVILDRSEENTEAFLSRHARKALSSEDKTTLLKLLEMQRNGMLMYTSCGWFFDEISGIETIQVMMYAARAMQLARDVAGVDLEGEFVKRLKKAPSNIYENGAYVYRHFVKPSSVDLYRVGAHYAISSVFEESPEEIRLASYSADIKEKYRDESGRLRILSGKATIISNITWESKRIDFTVFSMGDHNVTAGVKDLREERLYRTLIDELKGHFRKADVPGVIRTIDRYYKNSTFSLWHLFKDKQRKIIKGILESRYADMDALYRQIYENNYTVMNFLSSLNIPVPRSFLMAVEHTLNRELQELIDSEELDHEKLRGTFEEVKKWGVEIDRAGLSLLASSRIDAMMEGLRENPLDHALAEEINSLLKILRDFSLELNLWKSQNIYFSIGKQYLPQMKEGLARGDEEARHWVDVFRKLGYYLHVKIL